MHLDFQMNLKMNSTYSTLTPCGLQELWDSMAVTPDRVQIKSMWSPAGVQVGVWLSVKCSVKLLPPFKISNRAKMIT